MKVTYKCGPFDGGCVIFARALQIKFGSGQIEVLINDSGPQHAVLHDGNKFYDADGAAERREFKKRFEKNESIKITGVKSMHPSYLPDAPRDEKMSQQIAELLR